MVKVAAWRSILQTVKSLPAYIIEKSTCYASQIETAWNDRLSLFDAVHQILLQLNIDRINCKISAYEINEDYAYDLLPIKATSRRSTYGTNSNTLHFSRSKLNRAPLKYAMNRSNHAVLVDINKIEIKSIESALQYLERSHNLFKSSRANHYVFTITACNGIRYPLHHGQELRIVQLCTSDPLSTSFCFDNFYLFCCFCICLEREASR